MAEAKDRADVAVFARIGVIERLAAQRLERALPEGLSSTGLEVLNRLVLGAEAQSAPPLAKNPLLSKPAMTHTLQRLERQGLVSIAGDPADGRRKRVALTDAGAAAY